DRARGRVLGGFDRRGGGADRDRLIRAAGGDFLVVVGSEERRVGEVCGCRGGARAAGRGVVAVGGDADRAVRGQRRAGAVFVLVELPGDAAGGVRAQHAADVGLVVQGVPDRARGRVLGGFDRRGGGADRDRLIRAAGGDFLVVV